MRLLGPILALFPFPLDKRDITKTKDDLSKVANASNSYIYMKVVCEEDGNTYELQPDKTWKLFTAKGDPGQNGKPLEFSWDGTKLGVRVAGDKDYHYVDLKGLPGDNGKSLEFRWNGTELGVRVSGEEHYDYKDLKGEPGKSLEFRWNGTSLGVRQEGDVEDYNYYDLQAPKPTETEIIEIITQTSVGELNTESDKIVGAINELKGKLDDILLRLPESPGSGQTE